MLVTSHRSLVGLTEAPTPIALGTFNEADGLALLSATASHRVNAEPEAAREVVELCGRLPVRNRNTGS